jgi:Spy/CpxP family protein refolding chaperone
MLQNEANFGFRTLVLRTADDFDRRPFMTKHRPIVSMVSAAFALAIVSSAAGAQPFGSGSGMMGPGMMMGSRAGCGHGSPRFMQWRADRLADGLKLTDEQRAKFEVFKTASSKAADAMQTACAADVGTTMPGRMDAMEKRMEAMLAGMGTVRPALDAFYASLTEQQKAQFDSRSGRHRFWGMRDAW